MNSLERILKESDLDSLKKIDWGEQPVWEPRAPEVDPILHRALMLGSSLEVIKHIVESLRFPLGVLDSAGDAPCHIAVREKLPLDFLKLVFPPLGFQPPLGEIPSEPSQLLLLDGQRGFPLLAYQNTENETILSLASQHYGDSRIEQFKYILQQLKLLKRRTHSLLSSFSQITLSISKDLNLLL